MTTASVDIIIVATAGADAISGALAADRYIFTGANDGSGATLSMKGGDTTLNLQLAEANVAGTFDDGDINSLNTGAALNIAVNSQGTGTAASGMGTLRWAAVLT